MPTHHRRTRRTAFIAALAVAGASVAGAAVATGPALAAESHAAIDTVDYLGDTYGLTDTVVETVTFERFEYLLGQEGRFAFLIGGATDPTTAATIGTIDAVAKQAGVERVYLFDPKLDGVSLDIRTTTNADVAPLWPRLLTNALSKDTQTPFGQGADPYFFVYDASHTEGGVEDRIVAALTEPVTAAELADPAALEAYRAEVAAVIGDGASIDAISQFAFYDEVVDARHVGQVGTSEDWGGPTIIDSSDADWRIQNITYPELVHLLQSDGDFVLFFGGTWCHNTRAVLKEVNRQAAANGVDTVYFFDLRLDGLSGNDLHIRDSGSEFAHLYGDLVSAYLPNLKTQYVPGVSGQVEYHPGGDAAAPLVAAQKLQVPFVFEYDRSRVVDGAPAPVVRQWIRDNGNGTYTEYMTDWWWVQHRVGGNPANPNIAKNHAFADEAIAELAVFFEGLPAAGGGTDPTTPPTEPTTPPTQPTTPPQSGEDPTAIKGSVKVTGNLVPGGSITVTGSGLAEGTPGFAVELHSEPQSLGTVATDASGGFTLTATIPASTPAGAHTVVVLLDGVTVASASVTVAAATAAGLPSTGAGFVDGLGWLAVALIAGAAAAGAIVRHRAQRSQ